MPLQHGFLQKVRILFFFIIAEWRRFYQWLFSAVHWFVGKIYYIFTSSLLTKALIISISVSRLLFKQFITSCIWWHFQHKKTLPAVNSVLCPNPISVKRCIVLCYIENAILFRTQRRYLCTRTSHTLGTILHPPAAQVWSSRAWHRQFSTSQRPLSWHFVPIGHLTQSTPH